MAGSTVAICYTACNTGYGVCMDGSGLVAGSWYDRTRWVVCLGYRCSRWLFCNGIGEINRRRRRGRSPRILGLIDWIFNLINLLITSERLSSWIDN